MAAWIVLAALTGVTPAGADLPEPDETVVLRASDGQFLTVAEDGRLEPRGFCPAAEGRFDLFKLSGDRIALRAATGRFLVPSPGASERIFAAGDVTAPGFWESFSLVRLEGNQAGLRSCGTRRSVLPAGVAANPNEVSPDGSPQTEAVEIFLCRDVPDAIQTALGLAVQGAVNKELGEKEYSKVTTHDRNRYVTLPAPTLKDLRRKKQHQILGIPEEYHVRAKLIGEPEVVVTQMPYLTGYFDAADRSILFSIEARLPVEGSVSYKVPKLVSATTNYRVTVVLALAGEMQIHKEADQLSLASPELNRIDVTMQGLDLSNDVLQTMRRPIERTINGELRKNSDKIREEANNELAKAAGGQEFRHPLFRYLDIP